MTEDLYVEEGTGLVRKVKHWRGVVFTDEPYKPNEKCIFVNPETNFLEETEPVFGLFERYKKTSDFKSNGNEVIFHPDEKEFAEVKRGYSPCSYNKVKNLPIAS